MQTRSRPVPVAVNPTTGEVTVIPSPGSDALTEVLPAFLLGLPVSAPPAETTMPAMQLPPRFAGPAIAAGDEQPPLVATVLWAAEQLAAGAVPSDDALGRLLADQLAAAGGTPADLDYLIQEDCVPAWTAGYFRALVAA